MNGLALALALLCQQPPPPAPPVDVSEALFEVRERFDVPALGAALWKDGRLVAIGVDGERERGSDVAATVDDRFHLGSCTKAMTATVIAMAIEDGTLRWDSTVGEVFDDLAQDMDPAWRGVTLTQLLTHRAGAPPDLLGYGGLGLVVLGSKRPTPEMRVLLVKGVCALPPKTPPGSAYAYSNNGYMIAAAMLERATGKTWEDLIRERLFEPLGMTSAGFGPPSANGELDQPRGHWGNGKPSGRFDNPACYGPAGTVHATLEDWLKFLALHLAGARGEPTELLFADSFAHLHTPPAGAEPAYACGWVIADRPWAGGRVLTHDGSNTAWFCWVWIAPAEDMIVVAACNQGGDPGRSACDAAVTELLVERSRQSPPKDR